VKTVIDIPLDKRFRERYGNPYAVTHRADVLSQRSRSTICRKICAGRPMLWAGPNTLFVHYPLRGQLSSLAIRHGSARGLLPRAYRPGGNGFDIPPFTAGAVFGIDSGCIPGFFH
jgi:hypothetical protein